MFGELSVDDDDDDDDDDDYNDDNDEDGNDDIDGDDDDDDVNRNTQVGASFLLLFFNTFELGSIWLGNIDGTVK